MSRLTPIAAALGAGDPVQRAQALVDQVQAKRTTAAQKFAKATDEFSELALAVEAGEVDRPILDRARRALEGLESDVMTTEAALVRAHQRLADAQARVARDARRAAWRKVGEIHRDVVLHSVELEHHAGRFLEHLQATQRLSADMLAAIPPGAPLRGLHEHLAPGAISASVKAYLTRCGFPLVNLLAPERVLDVSVHLRQIGEAILALEAEPVDQQPQQAEQPAPAEVSA